MNSHKDWGVRIVNEEEQLIILFKKTCSFFFRFDNTQRIQKDGHPKFDTKAVSVYRFLNSHNLYFYTKRNVNFNLLITQIVILQYFNQISTFILKGKLKKKH